MKAPEKIYVHIRQKPCEITFSEVVEKDVSNIEYTRTDATWKHADGDNLPEIDREVIALVEENDYYKVVFAHRPNPNGDAICFDKGGWNMPDIRYWLDLELPKMENEL